MPSKTVGKLGNVGIAGVAWETSQVYHTSVDLTSGEQLLAAPSLYSRRNQITSLDLSCDTAGTLVTFSGASSGPTIGVLLDANDHKHLDYLDPLIFPTGVVTNITANQAANVYITAKYFVE